MNLIQKLKGKKLLIIIAFLLYIAFMLSCIFFVQPVFAQIPADETTETSIIWNLTGISNISSIALDGILITDYYPNVSKIIQNNLYPDEGHIITVIQTNGTKIEGKEYTKQSEQNIFFLSINNILIVLLTLIIFGIAILTEPMIGFIGVITAFIGLTTTVNYSFELGSIYVILIVAGFFIAIREK